MRKTFKYECVPTLLSLIVDHVTLLKVDSKCYQKMTRKTFIDQSDRNKGETFFQTSSQYIEPSTGVARYLGDHSVKKVTSLAHVGMLLMCH